MFLFIGEHLRSSIKILQITLGAQVYKSHGTEVPTNNTGHLSSIVYQLKAVAISDKETPKVAIAIRFKIALSPSK